MSECDGCFFRAADKAHDCKGGNCSCSDCNPSRAELLARIEALEGALRSAVEHLESCSPYDRWGLRDRGADNERIETLAECRALLPAPPSASCCHSPEPDKCAACNAEFAERRAALPAPRKEEPHNPELGRDCPCPICATLAEIIALADGGKEGK